MGEIQDAGVGTATKQIAKLQRSLGADDKWVTPLRAALLPPLHPFAAKMYDRPLIRQKGAEDYVWTWDTDEASVDSAVDGVYHRNLLSTRKYRIIQTEDGNRTQWELGSWRAVDPDDYRYQHHFYYFPSVTDRDGVDLYHHKEVNYVADPKGHENEPQQHGDPDKVLRGVVNDHDGQAWRSQSVLQKVVR